MSTSDHRHSGLSGSTNKTGLARLIDPVLGLHCQQNLVRQLFRWETGSLRRPEKPASALRPRKIATMGALQIFISNGALRSPLRSYLRRLLQDKGVHVLLYY